jgi:RND superfamily putative drug exporter
MLVAGVVTAVLAALAAFTVNYRASYDQSPYRGGSQAWQGYAELRTAFPAGVLAPMDVVVTSDAKPLEPAQLNGFATQLSHLDGVGSANVERVSADGRTADVQVAPTADPASTAAIHTATDVVAPAAHRLAPAGTTALVGGASAAYADVASAMNHDMTVIFPLAGLAILLVLMLALRSVIASAYMLGSVVLGFVATLGATVLLFQNIGHQAGVLFTVPIISYLFVASIGTDYNILIVSRLREELRSGASPQEAARSALKHAGPTVAAAGVVLAASFAVLGLSPTTAAIGIPVAIGVLISTFASAWLLVPALSTRFGRKLTPSRSAGPEADHELAAQVGHPSQG